MLLLALACGKPSLEEAETVAEVSSALADGMPAELTLSDRGLGPELATALVEHPEAASLRRLDLGGNLLGPTGAATLASLEGLERLDLGPGRIWMEGNHLGDAGARALLASPTLPALRWLDLSSNDIGPEALSTVTVQLQTLQLDSNRLGDEGCAALARLPLVELHLGWNEVGDACAEALSSSSTLEVLLLASNGIGDPGALALSRIQGLKKLYLSNNHIGDEGAAALASLPALEVLNLDGNGITDVGAERLAALPGLQFLTLEDNATSRDFSIPAAKDVEAGAEVPSGG